MPPPRLPPIHALTAFEAAARLGGFAPAAAELCITPSAVSHRIRQLESQLGEPLFDRNATGVRLTAHGQRYLTIVREAFDKLAEGSRAEAHATPQLTVSAPPTFARNLLIPQLPGFYRQWPDIQIDVAVQAPLQERFERHDIDIRYGQPPFDDRPCTLLFDDQLAVFGSADCLRRLGWPIELPAAAAALDPITILPRAAELGLLLRCPLTPWRPWFHAAGVDLPEPTRGASFTDLGILLEAAVSGLGLALCPLRVATHWLQISQLHQAFALSIPAPSGYFAAVDRQTAQRPEVAAFVDWLTHTLTPSPPAQPG